jgi:hypothetical protein
MTTTWSPLCHRVIFNDSPFPENYQDAGRDEESPVLNVARLNGQSFKPTSLFKIYENHFKVMYKQAKDITEARLEKHLNHSKKHEAIATLIDDDASNV